MNLFSTYMIEDQEGLNYLLTLFIPHSYYNILYFLIANINVCGISYPIFLYQSLRWRRITYCIDYFRQISSFDINYKKIVKKKGTHHLNAPAMLGLV